ncbi:hypothetical protein RHMOL_Rhmol11G0007400 [Rhododendron molle]|uniref:Uncharacterized protein n=1 Tax=Rhododendron molle TaxID=49168 RepID=A0ACC0LMK2_RHOML|nr:hypothetical protein RHMOL_Rhmol11G0007400 [Rhododendron molle]
MDRSSLLDDRTDRSSLLESRTDRSSLIESWTDRSSLIESQNLLVHRRTTVGDTKMLWFEGGDEVRRTPEGEQHATEDIGAARPNVEPLGSSIVAEGSPKVGGSSGDVGGSGAEGGDLRPIGATSSSHRPITKDDDAEYLSDEALAKLLEVNPAIGIAVLEAKEERARAIVALEAAESSERERKEREEPLRDVEAEEKLEQRHSGLECQPWQS